MTLAAAPQADADVQALLQVKKYREAFALLLPRYRDKVFRLTFSMLRNHAMAEDTTQDVFLRIWRALPGPLPVRLLLAAVLLLAVVAFCFLWLFPRIADHMPFNSNTVDSSGADAARVVRVVQTPLPGGSGVRS